MNKKTLVVLSGSGISAESGIPTFRGGDGMWDNVPLEDVCTPEGWHRNPAFVSAFYNKMRRRLKEVEPNEAHRIIASLEDAFEVYVITQNVDNLHERAGSSRVLHLHGELTKVRPDDCYTHQDGFSMKQVIDIGYRDVRDEERGGPRNRLLRPHIVFFGEAVPNIEPAMEIVSRADILVVIGTSMQVYPAASLHSYAPSDCRKFMIDPAEAPAHAIRGVTHIRKTATLGMKELEPLLRGL